jgi:hypothetical protein
MEFRLRKDAQGNRKRATVTGWFVVNYELEVVVMTPDHAFALAVAIINLGAAALKFAPSRTPQEKTLGF